MNIEENYARQTCSQYYKFARLTNACLNFTAQYPTIISQFNQLKKEKNDFEESPFFVHAIFSTIVDNRKTDSFKYFIKNINKDTFARCANGLTLPDFDDSKKCVTSKPLHSLLFHAICPHFKTVCRKMVNPEPKLINILLAHDDIDVNSPVIDQSGWHDYDLFIMDGGTPLDIVIEKIRNIPLAQALLLNGARLKLPLSDRGLIFYQSVITPLYEPSKWLILSKFDPQCKFQIFPEEVLSKIVYYQIKNAEQKVLPEDDHFPIAPPPYFEALHKLRSFNLFNQNERKYVYKRNEFMNLNKFFLLSASEPTLIRELQFMLKNAKILDIDIGVLDEESKNALDIAQKCKNEEAIILLESANHKPKHSNKPCVIQ